MNTTRLRTVFAPAVTAAALLVAPPPAVHADPPANTELNGDPIDPSTYRAFAGNYRHIAQFCAAFEDDFLVVPGYHRRIPNSRGLNLSRATDELTVTWRESRGGLVQTFEREPERAEVEAYINGLIDVRAGTYGSLAKVRVVAILGPEEMLVADLQLIDVEALEAEYRRDERRARDNGARDFRDALNQLYEHRLALKDLQEEEEEVLETTHRLVGYPTRRMRVGDVWAGPGDDGIPVAIARYAYMTEEQLSQVDRRYRGDADDPRMVLVEPTQAMRETLDEAGMMRLLAARGRTVAQFVEEMRELREEVRDRDEADRELVEALIAPMPEPPEDED